LEAAILSALSSEREGTAACSDGPSDSPAKLPFYTTAKAIPTARGAYLLVLELKRPLAIARPSVAMLPAGYYFYAGSACGQGGLKARIGRHMRRPKRHYWHVDQISAVAAVVGAFVWPGGNECTLAARWASVGTPVAGFGSSDCRRCRSHLLGPLASLPHPPTLGDEA